MAGKSPFFPDIKVGSRFFVFNSLKGSNLPGASETYNAASTMLQASFDKVKTQMSSAESQTKDGETVVSALSFLNIAYKTELETEKKFYEERLLNNPNIPAEYQHEIRALIGEKDFDYYRFMGLLKEIELGKEKWKKELMGMQEQITNFQSTLDTYYTMYGEQKFDPRDAKNENEIKNLIGTLFNDSSIGFLQHFTPAQKALHQAHAFSSAVLNSNRSQNSKELSKLLKEHLGTLIGGGNAQIVLTGAQVDAFVSNAGLIMLEEIYDLTGSTESSVIDINIAKKLINALENGETTDDPLQTVHAKNIRRRCDQLLKQLDLLEDYGQAMRPPSKMLTRISDKTGDIINLTKSVRTRVAAILDDDQLKQQAAKRFNGKEGKANKAAFLDRLNTVLHDRRKDNEFKDLIAQRLNNSGIVDTINKLVASNSKITISLQTEQNSAFTEQYLFNTFTKNIGGLNEKPDNFSFALGKGIATLEIPDDVAKQILPQLMDTYEQAYKIAHKEEIAKLSKDVFPPSFKKPQDMNDSDRAEIVHKLFGSSNSYSARADAKANSIAIAQTQKKLSELLKEYGIEENSSDKKYNLNDLFKIETSVKFSDYIFDNLGFKGGSLGATLFEQLENLNFIAEECGLGGIDMQDLTFAILNSGKGMIGNQYRPQLEEYLAIFASLLMFRTGSELAKQVKENITQNITITASATTSTMHLYTLGSVYVPASFILKTTYDALTKAKSYLDTEERVMGMQLQIINPVTEDDRVQHPPGFKYTQRGQAWYETAAKNYGRVSLSGRIMAGFLDVLEGIQGAMNGAGR